jgi:hypothetical protein
VGIQVGLPGYEDIVGDEVAETEGKQSLRFTTDFSQGLLQGLADLPPTVFFGVEPAGDPLQQPVDDTSPTGLPPDREIGPRVVTLSDGPLSAVHRHEVGSKCPGVTPRLRKWTAATLKDPDEIRRSTRFKDARLLSRWHPDLRAGKYVVVVVVSDRGLTRRHWIITAYAARRLAAGGPRWRQN